MKRNENEKKIIKWKDVFYFVVIFINLTFDSFGFYTPVKFNPFHKLVNAEEFSFNK